MDGGIDARLLITMAGMLVSIVAAAAIVKQKLAAVIEGMADLKKDYEARLRNLDSRVDRQENLIDLQKQKTEVLSSILSPSKLEANHRELERILIMSETNTDRIAHIEKIHNNSHLYVKKPNYED